MAVHNIELEHVEEKQIAGKANKTFIGLAKGVWEGTVNFVARIRRISGGSAFPGKAFLCRT